MFKDLPSIHYINRTFASKKVKQNCLVSKRLANIVKEIELRIWGSSLAIEQQNLKSEPGIPTNGGDIQKKLWELIKP